MAVTSREWRASGSDLGRCRLAGTFETGMVLADQPWRLGGFLLLVPARASKGRKCRMVAYDVYYIAARSSRAEIRQQTTDYRLQSRDKGKEMVLPVMV